MGGEGGVGGKRIGRRRVGCGGREGRGVSRREEWGKESVDEGLGRGRGRGRDCELSGVYVNLSVCVTEKKIQKN